MASELPSLSYEEKRPPVPKPKRRRDRLFGRFAALIDSVIWIVAAVWLLGLIAGALAVLFGPLPGYLGLFVALMLLPSIALAATSVRRRRVAAVLGYLEQAVRLNLPLAPALTAAARSERGATALRLRQVTSLLSAGESLTSALNEGMPETPSRALSLVHFAERNGRLPDVLDRLVKEDVSRARRTSGSLAFYNWYPLVLMFFIINVLVILLLFVMPKMRMIYQDFHLQLPTVTQWVMNPAIETVAYTAFAFVVAFIVVLAGRRTWQTFRPEAVELPGRAIKDRLLWVVPLARNLARDRGLADICQALADAISLGRPFDQALAEASLLDVNRVLRAQVQRWAGAAAGGLSPADSARAVGMPRLVVGLLATARGASDTVEVCRFLSRYYASRFSRAMALLYGAYVPGVVLLMGVIVALIALSLFLPIQGLIDALSPAWRGM